MDVVSFETAKRLKGAGFPQPAPDRGQLWYRNGTLYFARAFSGGDVKISRFNAGYDDWVTKRAFESFVYAPCVVDLLRHLPGLPVVCDGNGIFAVSGDFTGDESLPELLAKCWLAK